MLTGGLAGLFLVTGCGNQKAEDKTGDYRRVAGFLREHTEVVELSDPSGRTRLLIFPAWQGRVMTSTDGGLDGMSYGWVNEEFIASGEQLKQFNPFGGEDRIWIGPEGGQFSIFFPPDSDFDLADWQTPAAIDTEPFDLIRQADDQAEFAREFRLKNSSAAALLPQSPF